MRTDNFSPVPVELILFVAMLCFFYVKPFYCKIAATLLFSSLFYIASGSELGKESIRMASLEDVEISRRPSVSEYLGLGVVSPNYLLSKPLL